MNYLTGWQWRAAHLHAVVFSLIALIALLLSACDGGGNTGGPTTPSPKPPPSLTGVSISASANTLAEGQVINLTATGNYSDGSAKPITPLAIWASDDPATLSVSQNGVVVAKTQGSTTIRASFDNQTAALIVTVTPPTLVSLSVSQISASLPVGLTHQFSAEATYSNGTTQNITADAQWAASACCLALEAAGLIRATTTGYGEVGATYEGVSAVSSVSVTAPQITSVSVNLFKTSVAAGEQVTYDVYANYSDGSSRKVSYIRPSDGTFGTSDVATAYIEHTNQGNVHTIKPGSVDVIVSLGGVTGKSTLTVTNAALESITVNPFFIRIPVGQNGSLSAIANYTDGSSSQATGVTWTSSASSIATVDINGGIIAKAVGDATISATSAGIAGNAGVRVDPASVQNLVFQEASPSIAIGMTKGLHPIAFYSDGTQKQLSVATANVTYQSSDTSVASISTSGVAKGIAIGNTTISVTYGGVTESVTLRVTDAVLRTVAISPNPLNLPRGLPSQLTATGTFSDGKSAPMTSCNWSSSNTAEVTVTESGTAQAIGYIGATIAANCGGITGSVYAKPVKAALQGIFIYPDAITAPKGVEFQLQVRGNYSDGTTYGPLAAIWTSSNTTVSQVVSDSDGTARGGALGIGTATVTASVSTFTATARVDVTSIEEVSVALSPYTFALPVGQTKALTATSTFTDGTTKPTAIQSWTSSDTNIATVSTTGVVSGVSSGRAQITARSKLGHSAASFFTVVNLAIQAYDSTMVSDFNETQQLTFIETMEDGSKVDRTASATWSTSNANSLSIEAPGFIKARKTGSAIISATFNGVTASTGTIDVLQRVIPTLNVSPQLVPTNTYASVYWSSLGASRCTVQLPGGSSRTGTNGSASILITGTSTVSMTCEGAAGTESISKTISTY